MKDLETGKNYTSFYYLSTNLSTPHRQFKDCCSGTSRKTLYYPK